MKLVRGAERSGIGRLGEGGSAVEIDDDGDVGGRHVMVVVVARKAVLKYRYERLRDGEDGDRDDGMRWEGVELVWKAMGKDD